jgi:hypothetical protein
MPSKHPRLALTIPDELMPVLKAFARVEGKPVSAAVVDLLVEMKPTLEGIVRVSEAVKSGNDEAKQAAMRHMFGDNLASVLMASSPGTGRD